MIIERSLKLVVNPEEYESITIEGKVSYDTSVEPAGILPNEELVQNMLDAVMEEDIAAAAYVVNEHKDSFIKHWKVEV